MGWPEGIERVARCEMGERRGSTLKDGVTILLAAALMTASPA